MVFRRRPRYVVVPIRRRRLRFLPLLCGLMMFAVAWGLSWPIGLAILLTLATVALAYALRP